MIVFEPKSFLYAAKEQKGPQSLFQYIWVEVDP